MLKGTFKSSFFKGTLKHKFKMHFKIEIQKKGTLEPKFKTNLKIGLSNEF